MIVELAGLVPAMKRADLVRRLALTATALTGSLILSACGAGEAATIADAGTTVVVVQPVPTPTPTAAPTATPTPSSNQSLSSNTGFELGINLAGAAYWAKEPVFANLLTGSEWDPSGTDFDASKAGSVDAVDNPLLKDGQMARRILTPPASVLSGAGATVVCTWDGKGKVVMGGAHWKPVFNANDLTFEWPGDKGGVGAFSWLQILSSDTANPVRNFDCREKGVARSEVFGAEFLESLKPYGVLRFMDWSKVNGNHPEVRWSTRTRVDSLKQSEANYGIALEHMVALSNRMDADPWFNIPWNADEDYVRRMAQLVHDGIPGHRHVYVELSNEVWNYMFLVTGQAEKEGLAEGLATDRVEAMLLRYAEKSRWALKIWAQVFTDRPGQLVRVSGTQSANPWFSEIILGKGKLAGDVDALAIAPYFGHELFNGTGQGVTDTAVLLTALASQGQKAVNVDVQQQADVARKYGKRLIAYEAGQHIVNPNAVSLVAALNRAPAMYDIYKAYIAGWKAKVNDTMVLYNSTGSVSGYGAWGLREYAGQPLSETPKRRAVIDSGRERSSVRSTH